jgi:tRNA pseudouridine55 synthase
MNEFTGLLAIDKPVGPTSHDVVRLVRRLIGIRRIGHTGTLDPAASGLLVLCIGRATRLAEYLTGQSKSYIAGIQLGQETTTYDKEGEITGETPVHVTREQLLQALDQFQGDIRQVPPMYSAVKVAGQPLYRLARQGKIVERPSRQVTIHHLSLNQWKSPFLELTIDCSSGTYIRSIAHDLGQILGCGGYLADLRRTRVGDFLIEDALSLEKLDPEYIAARLQPIDRAVGHLPALTFNTDEARAICYGQPVSRRAGHPEVEVVRAYDDCGLFLGVVKNTGEFWKAHKIMIQSY